MMGAGEGPTAGLEARWGWGGHDTRLQPHDQGVVGERCGTCQKDQERPQEALVNQAAPTGPPTTPDAGAWASCVRQLSWPL